MNNLNLLTKIIFSLEKPKIIVIGGRERKTATEAVFYLLKNNFKVKKLSERFPGLLDIYNNEILILEMDLENSQIFEDFKFLIKKSQLPILIINQIEDDLVAKVRKLTKTLPVDGHLILNFDEETIKELREETNLKKITFGFQEGADLMVTDINFNSHTNFKINYKGSSVPIWLARVSDKQQIYPILGAIAVGIIFNLNLVEISNTLKNYRS